MLVSGYLLPKLNRLLPRQRIKGSWWIESNAWNPLDTDEVAKIARANFGLFRLILTARMGF
jgi:hypothetical protein